MQQSQETFCDKLRNISKKSLHLLFAIDVIMSLIVGGVMFLIMILYHPVNSCTHDSQIVGWFPTTSILKFMLGVATFVSFRGQNDHCGHWPERLVYYNHPGG